MVSCSKIGVHQQDRTRISEVLRATEVYRNYLTNSKNCIRQGAFLISTIVLVGTPLPRKTSLLVVITISNGSTFLSESVGW